MSVRNTIISKVRLLLLTKWLGRLIHHGQPGRFPWSSSAHSQCRTPVRTAKRTAVSTLTYVQERSINATQCTTTIDLVKFILICILLHSILNESTHLISSPSDPRTIPQPHFYPQYLLPKIQSKYSQNTVKIQPKYSQNTAKKSSNHVTPIE
jgi:hypothetical protein